MAGYKTCRSPTQHLGDRLCRGPCRKPLGADLGDDWAETPIESIEWSQARQRAAEAVRRAVVRLVDRRHFVITASDGIGQ
jgi:hypothetical protein